MGNKRNNSTYRQKNPRDLYYEPRTEAQNTLWEALQEDTLVCATGPAGTGKTYTAATMAAKALLEREVGRIVLTRANVPTGKSLGAVPGTLEEKLHPWMIPMLDVLSEHLSPQDVAYKVRTEKIQMVSLETIRGRSFPYSFIIVDEAQQLSIDEIKAITTRIGEGSTLCLMGDPNQTDLKRGTGYTKFMEILKRKEPESMSVVEFTIDDIVRSSTCATLVRLFHEEGI